MWSDLTKGRPEVEEQLSINARDMKADMCVAYETLIAIFSNALYLGILICLKQLRRWSILAVNQECLTCCV